MNVIEARQHGAGLDRHHPAGRLDDENDGLVFDRQSVAPARVGLGDFTAVRHQNARDARIARLASAAARAILEHDAGDGRGLGEAVAQRDARRGKRCRGRRAALHHVAARDVVVHDSPPGIASQSSGNRQRYDDAVTVQFNILRTYKPTHRREHLSSEIPRIADMERTC